MSDVATVKSADRPSRPLWANENGLDDQEYAFVREYLIDMNLTQAVFRAGLGSEDAHGAARVRGHRLFHRAHVQRAIDQALNSDGSGPRQWLINRLFQTARANIVDFIEYREVKDPRTGEVKYKRAIIKDLTALPEELQTLIKKVKVNDAGEITLELDDRLRAIEQLGKVSSIALTRDLSEVNSTTTLEALLERAAAKRDAQMIDVTPKKVEE